MVRDLRSPSHARSRRALTTSDGLLARAAAAALKHVSLADALALCLVLRGSERKEAFPMSAAGPDSGILAGENPFIRLRRVDSDGFTTNASCGRIVFSPEGAGHVLYLQRELGEPLAHLLRQAAAGNGVSGKLIRVRVV